MDSPFLSRTTYLVLFSILGIVYICGLFVPLMDNDAAHHANIALHMYLTGDYVSLVDHAGDYLDKPHLHFWLAALSYELFGVTGFAYKLPSFLFTILGLYSTYRLGKALYNSEVGKLAALLLASAFAFILANNDVRMDAILTACIAFTTWQLVWFIQSKRLLAAAGAALGLALGFATKGHIAVFVPVVGIFFYVLYRKEWSIFYNWKWLFVLGCFALLIFPVVYCYYLQYNLHPEKTVRGRDHIDGVKFILLTQSIERYSGGMEKGVKQDYFFFLHSFLWAFAPWSLLTLLAIFKRAKTFLNRSSEWLCIGTFLTVLLVVSFSGYKLPHYLNIVFPVSAICTASFIIEKGGEINWRNLFFGLQLAVSAVLLAGLAFINAWAFPVRNMGFIVVTTFFLSAIFYLIRSKAVDKTRKAVLVSFFSISLCFFLLNINFYPKLLRYQGGNQLAFETRTTINPQNAYFWPGVYNSSYNFYTASLRKEFGDSLLIPGKQTWLIYDKVAEEKIKAAGYNLDPQYELLDFEITKLTLKFLDPSKRVEQCTKLVVAEIFRQ